MTEPPEAANTSVLLNSWQTNLGLCAVVGAVALAAGSANSYLDSSPKRWRRLEKVDLRPCYQNLTSEHPSRGECFHYEDEETEIPQRYFDWKLPHVAVYSAPAPSHFAPTLRDLGEFSQAEAIRLLEKDLSVKGGAWATLRDALDQSSTEAGKGDPFRFDRVLIANVAKGIDWMPGDRMVWTRILVQPINFSFAGYTVAATDNQIKKVTSLETTDSRKFSADISATIPGMEGPKATLGPSSEHTVKANSDITAQYEKLGIDIVPNFMRIMRESETGGDAVGNTEVSLTAITDPDMIWRRYPQQPVQRPSNEEPIVLLVTPSKNNEANQTKEDEAKQTKKNEANRTEKDEAKQTKKDEANQTEKDEAKQTKDEANQTKKDELAIDVKPQVPVRHCALRARVWMLYEERRVDKGHDRYDESKQSVTLVRDAEDKQDVEVMGADEVSPAVWSIKLCDDLQCTKGEDVLRAKLQDSQEGKASGGKVPLSAEDEEPQGEWGRKVVFTDYSTAIKVAHWLRSHRAEQQTLNGYRFNYPIRYNGTKYAGLFKYLFRDNKTKYASLVPLKINKDECKLETPLLKRFARWLTGGRLFAEAGG